MPHPEPKPRMAFFRWTRPGLSGFLELHIREQFDSLQQFFDVTLIDRDCDYARVCDEVRPDISVFESGVYAGDRRITNTASHPEIPKLGFLHADAFDSSRVAFVSDMADWGVEWFFTTSMSMAEYTPEIADRLFVWPNAIDPEVFRDYQLRKNVPILFTGSQASHYPWRNAVSRAITPLFATMIMPHFGWNGEPGTAHMPRGEEYARLLNASTFVPTCGTMAKDVVRKHLEVPASMACLVTEQTPAIEAFGFEDMVNCLFADENDVVPRLSALLEQPELLERITRAGHELVHDHHTHRHRDQVRQWLQLVSEHGMNISIEQSWPDGRLAIASSAGSSLEKRGTGDPESRGRDRLLIEEGWLAAADREFELSERAFLRSLNYFFIPEAASGLVHTLLARGEVSAARDWSTRSLVPPLAHHLASCPDPVQWANEIRVMLCAGDLAGALAAARLYGSVSHVELDRMRAAVATITGRSIARESGAVARASICPVPKTSAAEWTAQLRAMLEASGMTSFSAALGAAGTPVTAVSARESARGMKRVEARVASIRSGNRRPPIERWVRRRLAPLKRRVVGDPWSRAFGDLLQREPVTHAVILLGADAPNRTSRAIEHGLLQNPLVETVITIEGASIGDARARFTDHVGSFDHAAKVMVFATENGGVVLRDSPLLFRASVVAFERTAGVSELALMQLLIDSGRYHVVDPEPGRAARIVLLRRVVTATDPTDFARSHPPITRRT